VMRRAIRTPDGGVEIVAFLINGSEETLQFELQGEFAWQAMIDSAKPELCGQDLVSATYTVEHNSAALLIAQIAPEPA